MAPPGILKVKKALLSGALSKELVGARKRDMCVSCPLFPLGSLYVTVRFMGSGVMLLFCIIKYEIRHSITLYGEWDGLLADLKELFILYNKRHRRGENTFILICSPVSPKECKVQGTVIQCE